MSDTRDTGNTQHFRRKKNDGCPFGSTVLSCHVPVECCTEILLFRFHPRDFPASLLASSACPAPVLYACNPRRLHLIASSRVGRRRTDSLSSHLFLRLSKSSLRNTLFGHSGMPEAQCCPCLLGTLKWTCFALGQSKITPDAVSNLKYGLVLPPAFSGRVTVL
jgi:hypothetical protein